MNNLGQELKKIKETSWEGYRRKNGVGIRNKVLIVYTVECAAFVAQQIGVKTAHPDVDVVGFTGCCDSAYAVRMLIALIRHPNVGAVLAVGNGCEYTRPHELARIAQEEEKYAESFYIQEEGGTASSIEKGTAMVREFLEKLKETPKCRMTIKDLVVGAECGGSDYTSGLAGNACVGCFFDLLVDLGGTAVFEEIMEAVGLKEYLVSRCENEILKKEMAFTYDKMIEHCRHIHQYSISPGNFVGGLSSIEEKSMGSLAKSGSRPITGICKVSQKPSHPGLWLLDSTPDPYFMGFGKTNPNDSEGLIALISSGCHLVFLVTGRGSTVGSAVAPTLKITGNAQTFEHLKGDLDFDASPVLRGEKSMEELAVSLCQEVICTCQGKPTCAEKLGHKEFYIPYKYQEARRVALPPCGQSL